MVVRRDVTQAIDDYDQGGDADEEGDELDEPLITQAGGEAALYFRWFHVRIIVHKCKKNIHLNILLRFLVGIR